MPYFAFVKFFGNLLKTLKISETIKGILDCFFSLPSTLIENRNTYLPTEETVTDFETVSFCVYNRKDKKYLEPLLGQIRKKIAFLGKLRKHFCFYSYFHVLYNVT